MLPDNQNNYFAILDSLKQKIRQGQLKAAHSVNVQMLAIYWEIGKTVANQEASEGWGKKTVEKLAIDLKAEFPEMKSFSPRNLRYMRSFAVAYPQFPILQGPLAKLESIEFQSDTILQAPLAKLTWYHHITLLDKVKDKDERLFYIYETAQNGWSRDVMVHQIEGGLYNRQGRIVSNFQTTIESNKSELVQQVFKDPYKFDFINLGKEAKERDIEDALTNQLTKFLLELGQYFSFMGRQYKVTLEDKEYFYDLLFYHTRLKRYIVIDLKIDEFKPEYKGKMEFYLAMADNQLKSEGDEPSIGLILCKTKGGLVAEYALRDSSKPIGIAEYKISESLPENIKGEMPTIEELEAEIEKEYQELKSPSQKRIEKLKASLSQFQKNELKQTATTEILFEIIDKSVVPLYQAVIASMDDFTELFYSKSYHFVGKRGPIQEISKLAEDWKDEEFLKSKYEFHFNYSLRGLKKAGTEAMDSNYGLNFKIDIYSYSFIILNYNNSQSFIKKLYHEQLTKEEITKIVELFYNMVLDDIERQIELLKED